MRTLRLKSLELNGYKTFASRTLFEFSGPITTVVGPNGSGKSNISDALRWVLGEQSYSVLRGRKTEDMIFSGSDKRPQSGMASVSIVFDNSEGWLPIDFSEVSVTRRAYRDGQNEYLINDQKTRLKDVTELLAKSALAERTYTIIGQGLVDTALTLKSDERRRLFEEAAGIGLFRARKEQSLRRLEATMRNLERAEDILAELRPRVRSLSRQAERAEEFMRLRSDLHETLRQWYGYHWHRAQKDLTEYRREADLREEGLGSARQKQAELSMELIELRSRAQTLRAQLGDWQRRLAEQNASREQAARSLAVAVERERALVERRHALAEEKQRLEAELKTQASRLAETEQDAERYRAEEAEATQHLTEARQVLEEKRSVQEKSRAKVEAARERVTAIEVKLNEAKARREQLMERLDRYRGEMAELQGTMDAMQGDAKVLGQQVAAAKVATAQAETSLEAARESKQLNDVELEATRAQLDKLETQRHSLLGQQARLQAELKALQEAEMASTGFAMGAKLLAERLGVIGGSLGREISVRPEYETAIAAALGAYADAVILPQGRDSEEALGVLETGEASATLLPLSAIRGDSKLRVQGENGLIGMAADLVDVSQELRPLVDLLLGRVLVANDRQAARQLLAKFAEAIQVVTLRGEIFHSAGPIEVRSKKMATGLARPREERELKVKLDESSSSLAQIEKGIAEKNSLITEFIENGKQLLEGIESSQLSVNAAKDSEQNLAMEEAQLAKQLDWFGMQKRSLENEIATAGAQVDDVSSSESTLGTDLSDARKALDEEAGVIVDVPMDEHHAQVAHWEMRLAVAQRALQEVERRLNERQLGQQRTEAQLTSHQERSAEVDKLMADLEAERAQAAMNQETVAGQIGTLNAQLSPAEAELKQAELALESQQNAESQALQDLSAAERSHTQAQISLGRQQEALEGLRSRIEDDFGLVAFQYEAGVSGPTPLPLGELVEQLPVVEALPPELEEALKHQRSQIRRLGSVNPEAQTEYIQVKERVQSMEEQVHDLRAAEVDLKQVIGELDVLMEKEFRTTFDRVAAEFRDIFGRLFAGGSAKLVLTDEVDMAATGIDIEARLPGKRSQRLALLSGGERSLTAAALVFALLKASPTPFCVMDEVDAMLDEANVGRFTEVLRELSKTTQFVLITHNRNTVQAADVIYGITMGRDTASQVISLKLDEVNERYTN